MCPGRKQKTKKWTGTCLKDTEASLDNLSIKILGVDNDQLVK